MILRFHSLSLLKTPNDRAGLPTKSLTNPAALRSPPKILPHSFQHPAPSGEHGRKMGTHTAAAQRCLGLDTPQLRSKQLIFFKHSHFLAAPPVRTGPSLRAASVPTAPWASIPLQEEKPIPAGGTGLQTCCSPGGLASSRHRFLTSPLSARETRGFPLPLETQSCAPAPWTPDWAGGRTNKHPGVFVL